MDRPRLQPVVLALFAILVVAAALRVAGIDHHLRHGAPQVDERNNFIDPVLRMWSARTPDPTVYMGYAGFFNYLIFLPVGVGQAVGGEVGAYVAARGVVAFFGTLSVWLLYRAARRLAGDGPALAAAAVLAVAPIEVRHTHFITPDVLVGTAALALAVLAQRTPSVRRHLWIGAVVGVATATKYSGLLLAPGAAAIALLERRPRALGVMAAAGLAAFALAAPYAVLGLPQGNSGFAGGIETYFGADPDTNRFLQGEGTSLAALPSFLRLSLGWTACLVAVWSLRAWREPAVAAAWSTVLATFVATIPANLVNPRHVIPAETAAALLFAVGLRPLARRPALLALLALASVASPAPRTAELVARFVRPAAVDRAAAWFDREIEGPALVLTSLERFRLPPDRFEIRLVGTLDDVAREAFPHYDLVVSAARGELARLGALDVVAQFPSEEGNEARPLTILRRRGTLPPEMRPESVASDPPQPPVAVAWDGGVESCWDVGAGEAATEARWTSPRRVTRVEIDARDWPQTFKLMGFEEGRGWRRLDVEPLRPTRPARQRVGSRTGQIYVLAPPPTLSALRIERAYGPAWSLCEVKIF